MTDLAFLPFDELLEQYFARPGVEAELARRYGTTVAVLVVDLPGMVTRTDTYGVGYALALAAAAQRAMAPVFAANGGEVVKHVADTVFVVFERPEAALVAALDAQRALHTFDAARPRPPGVPEAQGTRAHGHGRPHGDALRGCVGLGYGEALLVPGRDLFGAEVNRAFVLGEDVARGGEVLATDAFFRALGPVPAGVGAFRGPGERELEAGFAFHVLADYR